MMRAIISRPCSRTSVPVVKSVDKLIAVKPQVRTVRVLADKDQAKPSGHDSGESPEIDPEFQKEIDAYKANEANAARLTPAEELRTIVESVKFGTLSTFASSGPIKGYPLGSVLPYAVDDKGRIICALSNLSSHKKYACQPYLPWTMRGLFGTMYVVGVLGISQKTRFNPSCIIKPDEISFSVFRRCH